MLDAKLQPRPPCQYMGRVHDNIFIIIIQEGIQPFICPNIILVALYKQKCLLVIGI